MAKKQRVLTSFELDLAYTEANADVINAAREATLKWIDEWLVIATRVYCSVGIGDKPWYVPEASITKAKLRAMYRYRLLAERSRSFLVIAKAQLRCFEIYSGRSVVANSKII